MEHINDLKYIGTIDKFYQKIGVGTMILARPLRRGDVIVVIGEISYKGSAHDPSLVLQEVRDIETEHKKRKYAKAGEAIGISLEFRVRKGDRVYLVKSIKAHLFAEKAKTAAIKEIVVEKAATEEE